MAAAYLESVNVNVPGEQVLASMDEAMYVKLYRHLCMVHFNVEDADALEDYLWFFDCELKCVQRELVDILRPVWREFIKVKGGTNARIRNTEWMADITMLVESYCTLFSQNEYTAALGTSAAREHVRKQRNAVMSMYFDTVDKYGGLTRAKLFKLVGECLSIAQQANNEYCVKLVHALERAVHFVPHALHVHRNCDVSDDDYIMSPRSLTSVLARYADVARQLNSYVREEMKPYDDVLVKLNESVRLTATARRYIKSEHEKAAGVWIDGINEYQRIRDSNLDHISTAKWQRPLHGVFMRINDLHDANVLELQNSNSFYCRCGSKCPWKERHTNVAGQQRLLDDDIRVSSRSLATTTTAVDEPTTDTTSPRTLEDDVAETPGGLRGACVLAEMGQRQSTTHATDDADEDGELVEAVDDCRDKDANDNDDCDDESEHSETPNGHIAFTTKIMRALLTRILKYNEPRSCDYDDVTKRAIIYRAITKNLESGFVRAKKMLSVKKVVSVQPPKNWNVKHGFDAIATGWHVLVKARVGYAYYALFYLRERKRLVYVNGNGDVKKVGNLVRLVNLMKSRYARNKLKNHRGQQKRKRRTSAATVAHKNTRQPSSLSQAKSKSARAPSSSSSIETPYAKDNAAAYEQEQHSVTPTEPPQPKFSPALRPLNSDFRGRAPCAIPGCSQMCTQSCRNSNCDLYGRTDVGVCPNHQMSPETYGAMCSRVDVVNCHLEGCFHCFKHDCDNTWYCEPCWNAATKVSGPMTRAQHSSVLNRVRNAGEVECKNAECLYNGHVRNGKKRTTFYTTWDNIINCAKCGNSNSCLVCSVVRRVSDDEDDEHWDECEYFCSRSCADKSANNSRNSGTSGGTTTACKYPSANKHVLSQSFGVPQKCPKYT